MVPGESDGQRVRALTQTPNVLLYIPRPHTGYVIPTPRGRSGGGTLLSLSAFGLRPLKVPGEQNYMSS